MFKFAINTKDQRFLTGNYALKLTMTDVKDNKSTFDENFTINKKQADNVKSATIDQGKKKIFPYVWIIVGAIALIVVILLVYLKKIN